MGRIVISTNVSLDGVVQDPDGKEGFSLGGWFTESGGGDLAEWARIEFDEANHTEALLLGRRSDEWFAARWAESRPGEWAARLNGMPKYIVSATLERPRWSNATVLRGDVIGAVEKLKQAISGDIVVYASYQLGRILIENDLVDELRLFVFPVVVGAGERLFGQTSDRKLLRLDAVRSVGAGLVQLTYQPVRSRQMATSNSV